MLIILIIAQFGKLKMNAFIKIDVISLITRAEHYFL